MIHKLKNNSNFSKKLNTLSLVFILLSTLVGCEQARDSQTQAPLEGSNTAENHNDEMSESNQKEMENKMKDNEGFQYRGKIHRINLEGGFFGIITDKGTKLLPLNLEKSLQQDGAEVLFSGNINKEIMTIQQWGKPFQITSIKLTKPGISPNLPTH